MAIEVYKEIIGKWPLNAIVWSLSYNFFIKVPFLKHNSLITRSVSLDSKHVALYKDGTISSELGTWRHPHLARLVVSTLNMKSLDLL